jgi:hypothetical protein
MPQLNAAQASITLIQWTTDAAIPVAWLLLRRLLIEKLVTNGTALFVEPPNVLNAYVAQVP